MNGKRILSARAVPTLHLPSRAAQHHVSKSRKWRTVSACCALVSGDLDDCAGADRCDDRDATAGGGTIKSTVQSDLPPEGFKEEELQTVEMLLIDAMRAALSSLGKQNFWERVHSVPWENASVGSRRIRLLDSVQTDTQLVALAGVTFPQLDFLTSLVLKISKTSFRCVLSMKERILLTLSKLRCDLGFDVLCVFFGVNRRVCGKCFSSTICLLALVLKPCIHWMSKEDIMMTMPECFSRFRDTRIVLESIEIRIDSPGCLKCFLDMFSDCENMTTCKILVGAAPSGLITFLSKCYESKASCDRMLIESGWISGRMLQPFSDAVMADEGLCIERFCGDNNIKMYLLPSTEKTNQVSRSGAKFNAHMARARETVNTSIGRLREFKMLSGKLARSHLPEIDCIVTVIAGLANLTSPILANDSVIAVKNCSC